MFSKGRVPTQMIGIVAHFDFSIGIDNQLWGSFEGY